MWEIQVEIRGMSKSQRAGILELPGLYSINKEQ